MSLEVNTNYQPVIQSAVPCLQRVSTLQLDSPKILCSQLQTPRPRYLCHGEDKSPWGQLTHQQIHQNSPHWKPCLHLPLFTLASTDSQPLFTNPDERRRGIPTVAALQKWFSGSLSWFSLQKGCRMLLGHWLHFKTTQVLLESSFHLY